MLVDAGYPIYAHLARVFEMQTRHIELTNEFDLPLDIFERLKRPVPEIVFFGFPIILPETCLMRLPFAGLSPVSRARSS